MLIDFDSHKQLILSQSLWIIWFESSQKTQKTNHFWPRLTLTDWSAIGRLIKVSKPDCLLAGIFSLGVLVVHEKQHLWFRKQKHFISQWVVSREGGSTKTKTKVTYLLKIKFTITMTMKTNIKPTRPLVLDRSTLGTMGSPWKSPVSQVASSDSLSNESSPAETQTLLHCAACCFL